MSAIDNLPGRVEVLKLLHTASYHYADDTASEWPKARDAVAKAVDLAIEHEWRFWQLREVLRGQNLLVTLDQLVEAILARLYRKKPAE